MPRTAAAKVTPWHPFWAAEGRFGPIAAFSDLRRAVMTGVSVQAPRGDHKRPSVASWVPSARKAASRGCQNGPHKPQIESETREPK